MTEIVRKAERGSVSAVFRQPPPVVDVSLGWHPQVLSIKEAEKLEAELQAAILQAKGLSTILR